MGRLAGAIKVSLMLYSAQCLAICNIEQLLQMEAFSRRHCCLVAPVRGSYDKHRKEMKKILEIKPKGMVTEAIHYMNILYLMNRQVNIKTITILEKSRLTEKEAVERYSVYFKIFRNFRRTVFCLCTGIF